MFDVYARRARIAPAVIASAPAALLVGVSIIDLNATSAALGVIVGACGIVVCGLVRGEGLRIQPDLWDNWGGPPTTQKLRWSQGHPDVVSRRHFHLESITGERLPTAAEENADPTAADLKYANAVEILREKTRGPQFAPIASENAEYGFRRNCLGIRPFAVGLALTVAVTSVVLIFAQGSERFWVDTAVALVAACGWWKFVSPGWVRSAAELYADRLFEAAAGLAAQ